MRLGVAILFAALAAALQPAAADARPAEAANPFTTAKSRAALIHFVPLDLRARGLVIAAFPAVKKYLHYPVEITAVPTAKPNWMNAGRGQLNGRAAMDDLSARFRKAQGNRSSFFLFVSSKSMYDTEFANINFVFGARGLAVPGDTRKQATAIVATANMRVVQPEREKARMTKMMLRYIGEVLCRLPRNSNPKSVLYTPILGCPDFDRMVATLPARC